MVHTKYFQHSIWKGFSPKAELDSAAVSIFVVILVELTNTVFVNSTNITTNIETAVLSRQNERHLKSLGTGKQHFKHFIKVTLFTNYNPPCRLLSSWPPSQARSFPFCQPPSKSRWKPSVFLVGDLLLLYVFRLHDHLVNHIFDQFSNILQINDCVIDFNSSPEQALRVLNTHSNVEG